MSWLWQRVTETAERSLARRCTNHVSFSLQCSFTWWQREPFKVQQTGDCFSVWTWMLCFINAKFLVLIKTWRFMDTWAAFVLSALGNKRVVKSENHFCCFYMLGHENWEKEQFTGVKNIHTRAETCCMNLTPFARLRFADFKQSSITFLAAVNISSVFRWICGCFPPSTQQQNIRDLGERFTLSLWRDTGWPDHRFDGRVEDCGTEGESLWWRLLLDTGPKLNHVSVTVGGYGEGKWFLTMGEKDLYS